jgi:hypothetical protein
MMESTGRLKQSLSGSIANVLPRWHATVDGCGRWVRGVADVGGDVDYIQ